MWHEANFHRSYGRRTATTTVELFNSWLILCHRVVYVCVCHPWHWTHRISNSVFLFSFCCCCCCSPSFWIWFVSFHFVFVVFVHLILIRLCRRTLCSTTVDWLKCQYGFMSILAIVVNSNQCHTIAWQRESVFVSLWQKKNIYSISILFSILPIGWWFFKLKKTCRIPHNFFSPNCTFS